MTENGHMSPRSHARTLWYQYLCPVHVHLQGEWTLLSALPSEFGLPRTTLVVDKVRSRRQSHSAEGRKFVLESSFSVSPTNLKSQCTIDTGIIGGFWYPKISVVNLRIATQFSPHSRVTQLKHPGRSRLR